MKAEQDRVRRFHVAMAEMGARGDVGDPACPGLEWDAAVLRARMLLEETTETMIALIGQVMTDRLILQRRFEIDEMSVEMLERNTGPEAIADGLADVVVIVLGTAVAAGIDLGPVFDEVMDVNERKIGPGARVRSDGKLLKPPGWRGPDIGAVLARQKAPAVCRMVPCPQCGGDTAIDGTTYAVCTAGCGWSRRLRHG